MKYTRRIIAVLLAVMMILSVLPTALASSFTDVKDTKWYAEAVEYCVSNGIMSGIGDGKFDPNGMVTREQGVQALYALDGASVEAEKLFPDVKTTKWYAPAVTWGAKNEIVAGLGDGTFGVGQNVTREQMASFFFRYANFVKADTAARDDLASFPDKGDTSKWAKDSVQWAVAAKILSGKGQKDGSTLLKPKDPLTRAELAQMMMQFHKLINAEEDLTGKTVILHSNDVHGAIAGYAFIAAQKAEFEELGAEVILADAGDYSQGTTNVSLSKGANAIDLMNLVGYDVATLGNHEFDYGAPQLFDNLSKAEFAVTCADVLKDGEAIYDPYVVIEKGGVKVAFVGLETPEAQTKANPALIQGLTFLSNDTDPAIWAETQKQVDAAKAEADIVIGLVHLGVDGESEPYRSVDMLKEVTGFDFVIDGHSHTVMVEGPDGEPIQSTGTAFANIGAIVIDNATKTIEDNYLIPITEESAADPEVTAAAQAIILAIAEEYGAKFATSEVDLNGDKAPNGNRDSETNNGDFITDAMLWSVTEQNPGSITGVPAENIVAITNGGGIRAWIHKGDVTKNDIFTVLPFGNTVAVVYVTGAELLEALEASTYCTPEAVGGFPQIAGMNITIDTSKEYDANAETYPGSTYYGPATINRVTINDVNGQPFDPTATYAVVTNNFCAAGGDTYYAFAAASSQFDTGRPLDEVVMDYVTEKLGGVIPASLYEAPQGRITVKAENPDAVNFEFLVTSDLHGQIYATDYTDAYAKAGSYKRGLTRVASYIKEQKAEYGDNVYTVDMGDSIQGAPMTYYYAFNKLDKFQPFPLAMRAIGYDMWIVGNHEFNYGLSILNKQIADATAPAGEGVVGNPVKVCMANYLKAETNNAEAKDWATWNDFAPYQIKEFNDGDKTVKVAVIGFGNPNVPKWDIPANWDGIYFADIIETYKHYEAEMLEKADMIVVVAHSGIGSDEGADFMERLVSETNTIAFAFSGHEHGNQVYMAKNNDGNEIPILQPYTKARAISQVDVSYNTADDSYTVDAKNINMEGYTIDEDVAALLKPYEDAAWNDYMLQPIGKALGDYPAANLGTAPSAFMDLINTVQLWGAYDRTGENTPEDTSDDTMAMLSISAPLTAGDKENLISEGEIMLGDMFGLYRFENWFYQITMTGEEVHQWLEFAATKIQVDEEGNPYVTSGDLTYYDIIFGDGFSYVIDYTKPEGKRIVSMTYNGEEVAPDFPFTVVVNNYRYNGGGNYVAWLNSHGCEFIANDPDRIIYSTQFDMIQGEDEGQARTLLTRYIESETSANGGITPVISSTWSLKTVEDTFTFAVFSTTDMHGRATTNDVASQKEDVNSMERVATIVKEQREVYGDNMLLIDNGDLIQGTLIAQYAINNKADVINPMIQALAEIGYDVYEMGNHEFNFSPEQRNIQVEFAEENGIAVLGGNIVLKTDGKNIHGEDVKAGEPFYDPYYIKELDAGNGKTVRVAVIGLGNAANETWDLATNYPNLQFNSLDNPDGLLENEINKWSSYIVENDLADIIIVSAHSGKSTDDGVESDNFILESQAISGAKGAHDVDLLIYGHDHTENVEKITNADGKEIYIVNGGGTSVTKNEFTVTFDEEGQVKDFTVSGETLALKDVAADEELGAILQPWYDETYAWAASPLGKFDNGWTDLTWQAEGKKNEDMILSQNAMMDFVHKAQIWCSWLSYETEGVEGATVSIASPVFGKDSSGYLNFIPKDGDTISMLELSKLYRYSNNLLCAVDMTGEQLLAWMSCVADMYTIKDGKPAMANGVSVYGLDTFYGVDYTFDLTKPAGERVVTATYNGTELSEYEGKIRVTLNSYRLSGGYGFYEATGLTEADCCWTAYQFLGEDRAPVPTMLGEYVAHMGTVTPDDAISHGFDSTWTLICDEDLAGKTVILHTNDVHGAIAGYAYIAALKAEYEAKGAEVILADAGDYSQGTTYVSLSKGANAVDMMNLVGYDIATLGNHEFDYGAAQLAENLFKAEFAITCSNVLEEGESIYDPYVIIEKDGVKVAFIGLETPEAQTKANPALIQGLTFLTNETDPTLWANTQAQVDAAKADGADVVIALAHLGVDESSRPYTSMDLLSAVEGIDFVIDGHSHTVMEAGKNGEPIQSTGTAFANVGCIVIDNETKTIEDNYLIPVDENTPKDETVAAAAQEILDAIAEEYGAKFAESLVDLNGAKAPNGNRDSETNNGDLITDAMIWCVTEQYPGSIAEVPAENIVAITNGGGIRAAISKGDVTKNDIFTVLPFGNTVAVVYVTGAELLEALEASTYCTPVSLGGFPQVAGIKFSIDLNKDYDANAETYPGSTYYGPASINRVTITEVNGKAFDPAAKYAIVTNNFCAGGGDTYYAFAAASSQFDTGYTLDAVVMDYITEKLGGVIGEDYADPQGRITIIPKEVVPEWDRTVTIGGTTLNVWFTKYGNTYCDCTEAHFTGTDDNGFGFKEGDIVTVSFLGQSIDLPVGTNYSDVDSGTPMIKINAGGYIEFAINMGNFGSTYGLVDIVKGTDGTYTITPKEGVTFPVEITFELKEAGGYAAELAMHRLNRTNNREDYADLTDAEFANFRQITTTGMGDNLYRGSSPINPEIGRNTYADDAIEAAGVTVIMNLADSKEIAEGYEGYAESYYAGQNVIFLNLGVDFTADDFKAGLAEGLKFFAANEGTYYVHCSEGKDRAGFVSALLECLMGATYDEVVADYMVTYYNYYGVTTDDERYDPIAKSNIIKTLCTAFGVDDLSTADLAAEAEEYFKTDLGLSDGVISALKANLAK